MFSAADEKAIGWYCKDRDLIPQLSTIAELRFKERAAGQIVTAQLKDVVEQYQEWKTEDQKERRKQRARERAAEKRELERRR